MDKLIFLTGPSASGKSSLSLELAQKLNLEIISVDSLLVYKYFDIGTAKPSKEEQKKIKHHMIDIVDPKDDYSVNEYQKDVFKIIKNLNTKDKKYLFVGGTGFYINAIVNGTFTAPPSNNKIKEKLQEDLEKKGLEKLYEDLRAIDLESSQRIHPNDKYRVLRALEVYYTSNKTMTHYRKLHEEKEPIDSTIIVLNPPKEELNNSIKQRTTLMQNEGLIDEVKILIDKGYKETKPMKSIGYKEVREYIEKKITRQEMIDKINQETKMLAKRQITWFKKQKNTFWINSKKEYNKVEEMIKTYL